MTKSFPNPDLFKIVEIEVNSNCNRACSYCPNSQVERVEKGDMEIALFDQIMQQLVDLNFVGRVSYHFYNEPLLCKNLNLFISKTRDALNRSVVHIYSNGTLLTRERLYELVDLGVERFTITRHEHSQSERYVFEQVWHTLEQSMKDRITYKPFTDLVMTNRGGILEEITNPQVGPMLPCFIPSYLMVITVNGTVLPCYEDYLQKEPMGNVKEQHLREIWNSPRYQDFRNRLFKKNQRQYSPLCANCNNFKVSP